MCTSGPSQNFYNQVDVVKATHENGYNFGSYMELAPFLTISHIRAPSSLASFATGIVLHLISVVFLVCPSFSFRLILIYSHFPAYDFFSPFISIISILFKCVAVIVVVVVAFFINSTIHSLIFYTCVFCTCYTII